jgi:hypothetical protein
MSHTANISWIKKWNSFQPSPDISYSLFFRVVIMPNISFMANNSFSFEKGAFTRYNGIISASAVF